MQWQVSLLPPTLMRVVASIPAALTQRRFERERFTSAMRDDYQACRKIGDAWYDEAKPALPWVPSVDSAFESNMLLNRRYPDFAWIAVRPAVPEAVDPWFRSSG